MDDKKMNSLDRYEFMSMVIENLEKCTSQESIDMMVEVMRRDLDAMHRQASISLKLQF